MARPQWFIKLIERFFPDRFALARLTNIAPIGFMTDKALFEGDESLVNELIEYCKSGQPYAKVRSADVEYSEHMNEFKDFKIKH